MKYMFALVFVFICITLLLLPLNFTYHSMIQSLNIAKSLDHLCSLLSIFLPHITWHQQQISLTHVFGNIICLPPIFNKTQFETEIVSKNERQFHNSVSCYLQILNLTVEVKLYFFQYLEIWIITK